MITSLYVGRPTMRPHLNTRVRLRFNPDSSLAGRTAETWARSIARDLWGHINDQKKVRARALPGPTWWFSCSGHGGYVMIARTDQVPTWWSHFVEDGQPVWTDGQYAPNIAAYVFEEDCNWAVLYATYYPQLIERGAHGHPTLQQVLATVASEQPQAIKDALLSGSGTLS